MVYKAAYRPLKGYVHSDAEVAMRLRPDSDGKLGSFAAGRLLSTMSKFGSTVLSSFT